MPNVNVKNDYNSMSKLAQEIRDEGKLINNSLITAYNEVKSMYDASEWRGISYNELVGDFQKISPDLEEILKIVVQNVPYALETVANNYSVADSGSKVKPAVNEPPKKLPTLILGQTKYMQYEEGKIATRADKICKELDSVINRIDSIDAKFGKIQWEGIAADAFKVKFKNLKNKTKSALESIRKQFKQIIDTRKENMRRTEKANTAN